MQTKKKTSGRSSTREVASPRVSRHQKKIPPEVQVQENKVSDIITSSVRKSKPAGTQVKKSKENVDATNLNTRYGLVDADTTTRTVRDGNHAIDNGSVDPKASEGSAPCVTGTIFSPAFHVSRNVGGEMSSGADFIKYFHKGNDQFQDCGKENVQVDLLNVHDMQEKSCSNDEQMTFDSLSYADLGTGLSSEVSAIYNTMKNSKLECVDEHEEEHVSTDVCMEDEEYEEFDEFDPYFFMKNLPELSTIVSAFRPVLLPKQTRSCPSTTLVLDLDETLVHSTLEPCDDADFTFSVNFNLTDHTVYVRCRPHLKDFMEKVTGRFEIIIFTASQSIYAEQLLNVLDPKRKVFRHRVYRESCVFVEGNYLKDLSVLGRDLAHVVIIDNSPQAFGYQVDNGIPIESWFDDRSDQELISLLPFLESLIEVEDVRPVIAQKFNLRQKISDAVCPQSYNNVVGDPFKR